MSSLCLPAPENHSGPGGRIAEPEPGSSGRDQGGMVAAGVCVWWGAVESTFWVRVSTSLHQPGFFFLWEGKGPGKA